MNRLILMKNLNIENYHQKKVFILQKMMEKNVKMMDIFLVADIYT